MPDFSDLERDLERMAEELNMLSEELPLFIEEEAAKIIEESFNEESYQGREGSEKWPERKRPRNARDRIAERRNLLVASGRMKRSFHVFRRGQDIVISTDSEYAPVHNEGREIKVNARKGKVRHRLDAKGNLVRQKDHDKLAVFAKKGHKRVREQEVDIGEHTIKMPKRQAMPIPGEDFPVMDKKVKDFADEKMKNILGRQG